ncbi:DNA/RNA non-specific endonuclease [Streptomyces sp. ME02-8801-2C]|uniref:DNA/RNA non-specific endonuclease n=1 Tax=Streptomyces sp. ME02-8801-2C TaxID=3028680 RepID=UPI0029B8E894|nr:DNA/RNA non-specific endonuclease [Streptomyces sp. ME02-8801-2C]MDX3452713.1 DNA/RNA non-specific endonuclease [Streptomyces sp. ME02-8801-2C]
MVTNSKKKTATPPRRSAPAQDRMIESLRHYIRAHGQDLLKDPNVSSVGIGQKVRNGTRGKQIVLQFTVSSKVAPEAMEALGTNRIPQTITVDGFEVPTDVVERSYTPHFRVVAEVRKPERKTRLNPVVPGASVGGVSVSAGTIGCIVFDKADGTPYVLSNWHVLQGPDGDLGEAVVQPGKFDDNRVSLNRLGVLRRSHLGAAGDCAVATLDPSRDFDRKICELDVVPEELGEPELGDKVIKSGRTTGVTHGVVRRIDTMVKIDYGGDVGERIIGCFEIGPDADNPAVDGEISSGGDSGAVWLFKQSNGRPSGIIAGVHFGGEDDSDSDEHALACLSSSVFEKLDISLQRPAPEEVTAVRGYDPGFLGEQIDLPQLTTEVSGDAVRLEGSEVIPYTHFSLALSKKRRFPFWVGWNIDGGSLKRLSRSGIPFTKDPRLPANVQVGNELYEANRLDRGHIARRADLLWGSLPEAEKANIDSFFYTNITPQMDDFNQSARNGLWGKLEDAVFADVDVDDLKVSVFGGPVFQDDDHVFRGVKIPREFWKVITYTERGELKAKAFVLTQNLVQIESLDLEEFRVFQVTLDEIEERARVRFPSTLHKGDKLLVSKAPAERTPLETLADIHWD